MCLQSDFPNGLPPQEIWTIRIDKFHCIICNAKCIINTQYNIITNIMAYYQSEIETWSGTEFCSLLKPSLFTGIIFRNIDIS